MLGPSNGGWFWESDLRMHWRFSGIFEFRWLIIQKNVYNALSSFTPVCLCLESFSSSRGFFGHNEWATNNIPHDSNKISKENSSIFQGIRLTEEILHQLICWLSPYLQGFIHPRCCRLKDRISRKRLIPGIHCLWTRSTKFLLRMPAASTHVTWTVKISTGTGTPCTFTSVFSFSNGWTTHPKVQGWKDLNALHALRF